MTTPTPKSAPNSYNTPSGTPGPLNEHPGVGDAAGQDNPFRTNLFRQGQADNVNLNPQNQPAQMQTLVYSPNVRVLVLNSRTGIEYDISADIVGGTLARKENSVSSFFVTLANPWHRYDGLLDRMDRITVYMKRVTWIQVFSGYLDTVPLIQMWPGTVRLEASCTLKRLLHTWWNPALPASAGLFVQYNQMQMLEGDGQSGPMPGSSLGGLLATLLVKIGGWSPTNVHIQNFPTSFLQFLTNGWQQLSASNRDQAFKFKALLEGTPSAGPGAYASQAHLAVGSTPANAGFNSGAPGYIMAIIHATDALNMGPNTQALQNSYGVTEAATAGQQTRDAAVKTAFTGLTNISQAQTQQIEAADAAILALACAMVESGGGTTALVNYANPSVPDSFNYSSIPESSQGTSIGLFQQQNSWGSTAQRMTPFDAAELFLLQLQKFQWWSMDPALAIQSVQNGDPKNQALYAAAMPVATATIQSMRAAAGQYTPTDIAGIGASNVVGSIPGVGSLPGVGNIGSAALPTVAPEAVNAATAAAGGLIADSEGAINCAMTLLGRPYHYGDAGPLSFDCSGLWKYCFAAINIAIDHDAATQTNYFPIPPATAFRGCLINPPGLGGQGMHGHVVMYLGAESGGMAIECGGPTNNVHVFNYAAEYGSLANAAGCGYICRNGGVNPAAPFTAPIGAASGGVSPGSGQGSAGGVNADNEPIARNLFSQMFEAQFATPEANLFYGEKSFIDDQPLIQMVQSIAGAGMRKFQSAPNGDFIAYYPDYFGFDGHPINMYIEDIEIKDVTIDLSDDMLTTHVYITGDFMAGAPGGSAIMNALTTAGVATVENQTLFSQLQKAVFNPEILSGTDIMKKYGVRPLNISFPSAGSQEMEFFLACQLFTQKWAEQYRTRISLTFMPELFPGMRIRLNSKHIDVYVSEVYHSFDFEQQGFATQVVIMAPANPDAARNVEGGMGVPPNTSTWGPNSTAVPNQQGAGVGSFTPDSLFGQEVQNPNSGIWSAPISPLSPQTGG